MGFKNKSMLNSIVEKEMLEGTESTVSVKLDLEHNSINYSIIRKQVYKKDINGFLKQENTTLEIYQKQNDGSNNYC